jgi:hypothetical protein
MKWFGAPWNPNVCTPETRAKTPLHAFCFQCERPILERDQGVILASGEPHHLDCFLHAVGVLPCEPRFHPPTKETLS